MATSAHGIVKLITAQKVLICCQFGGHGLTAQSVNPSNHEDVDLNLWAVVLYLFGYRYSRSIVHSSVVTLSRRRMSFALKIVSS